MNDEIHHGKSWPEHKMIDETQWGPLSHDSEKKPTVGEEILGLLLIYW